MPRGVGVALIGMLLALLATGILLALPATAAAGGRVSTRVDFGPLSTAGLKRVRAAPEAFPVTLQLGLVADQKGIKAASRAGSDPSSPSYGRYPTLPELRRRLGAPATRQRDVLRALRAVGARGVVDATGLRVTAGMTIGRLEKLFATDWSVYATGSAGVFVALPDRRPRVGAGLRGNVDVVAGARPFLFNSTARTTRSTVTRRTLSRQPASSAGPYAGGTATRTGTVGESCLTAEDPAALSSPVGLFPNQILTAYGLDALHRQGLKGQGVKLAIVGEAPTLPADVELFRRCFGFVGTPLRIHGGADVQPIGESSLDAMVASMVAPSLAGFDLWVRSLADDTDDGDVEGFLKLLAAPLEADRTGASLPDVISVSYGICEAQVAPFTASRTLVERTLAAYAALGITVVVASGDSGSSTCARGISAAQLTVAQKQPYVSWPASSPWVRSVGGTNLTLNPDNSIASTGVWNDTVFPAPYTASAGGGGGISLFEPRPWWQPARSFSRAGRRMVPDLAAFADVTPGYAIVCSTGVQGCGASHQPGQSVAFVGGTSAAAPLVAGMIALWNQRLRSQGLPGIGFAPPLLYAIAERDASAFVDVTLGSNAIFDVSCCSARPGYDLATGLGSPLADAVAAALAG
jgi:kumamolisin